MKKIILIQILLFVLISGLASQPEWVWQYPTPQGNTLTDIHHFNKDTAVAIGLGGIIMRTTNAGINWLKLQNDTIVNLLALAFKDNDTGLAVSKDMFSSTILRTTDAGETWKYFNRINSSIGASDIFYMGKERVGVLIGNRLWISPNGGITFEIAGSLDQSFSLYYGCFTDVNNGFISAQAGRIYQTTDRGVTWSETRLGIFAGLGRIKFTDMNTGYVSARNIMYKTTNRGLNWTQLAEALPGSGDIMDFEFFNNDLTWAIGNNGTIWKTFDSGNNWLTYNTGQTLTSVSFGDINNGIAVARYGHIIRTTNSGLTWIQVTDTVSNPTGSNLKDIFFTDVNTGYAVGTNGRIMKTTNSGTNWLIKNPVVTSQLNTVYFINQTTGVIGGAEGVVLRTTNSGNSWNIQNIGSPMWITDIFFSNENSGIVTTEGGVYSTGNGGLNWTFIVNSPKLEEFHFINATTGAGVAFKSIFMTTNSGLNWDLKFSYTANDSIHYSSVFMTNPNTIYASNFESVLRTTNSGVNWIYTGMMSANNNRIIFSDSAHGFTFGTNYRTTNAGVNWLLMHVNVGTVIQSSYFVNGNTGWVVSDNGSIMKTTNAGGTLSFTVTGTVKYQDNNQPVARGYVKAFKHSALGGDVVLYDSVRIQSNGTYTLSGIPQDTINLMAFDDDEVLYAPSFVPTYYPSTIYWQQAEHLYPTSNLTGIDVGVYRITNDMQNSGKVSGGVFLNALASDITGIKDAYLYAKVGNLFRGYSVSSGSGLYMIDSLPHGTYDIICNRMGFVTKTRTETLGNINLTDINFYYGILTGIPNSQLPVSYSLSQNYPNPFNPVTKIQFEIPAGYRGLSKLIVYDVIGQEVAALVNDEIVPGKYEIDFNAADLPSGVYFYKLESGDFMDVKKMVLIK